MSIEKSKELLRVSSSSYRDAAVPPDLPFEEWSDKRIQAERWNDPAWDRLNHSFNSQASNNSNLHLHRNKYQRRKSHGGSHKNLHPKHEQELENVKRDSDVAWGHFEDQQTVHLPCSISPKEWKRVCDIFPGVDLDIFDDRPVFPNLVNSSKHLLHSEFVRSFISSINTLMYLGDSTRFTIEYTSSKFTPQTIGLPWRPWDHIYSNKYAAEKCAHLPTVNPIGKYVVRLFWLGAWRIIYVDDKVAVDVHNNVLLPSLVPIKSGTSQDEDSSSTRKYNTLVIWPFLLSKALLKLASLTWYEDKEIVDFDIIHCFTGWIPQKVNTTGLSASEIWTTFWSNTTNMSAPEETNPPTTDDKKANAESKKGNLKKKKKKQKEEAVQESKGKESKSTDGKDSTSNHQEAKKEDVHEKSSKNTDAENTKQNETEDENKEENDDEKEKLDQELLEDETDETTRYCLVVNCEDMRNFSASKDSSSLFPCWSHEFLIDETRNVPITRKNEPIPLENWKRIRWISWAAKRGILRHEDGGEDVMSCKIISAFKHVADHIVYEHPMPIDLDLSTSRLSVSTGNNSVSGHEDNPNAVGMKTGISVQSMNSTRESELSLDDLSFWVPFDKLSDHMNSFTIYFKPSTFKTKIRISDIEEQQEEKTKKRNEEASNWKIIVNPITMRKIRNEPIYIFTDTSNIKLLVITMSQIGYADILESDVNYTQAEASPPKSKCTFCLAALVKRVKGGKEVRKKPPTDDSKPEKKVVRHDRSCSHIVLEEYDWTTDRLGNTVTSLNTFGSKATTLELGPGRKVLKLWIKSDTSYVTQIFSNSRVVAGDLEEILYYMSRECQLLQDKCDEISYCFLKLIGEFGTPDFPSRLKEFYQCYKPEGSLTKSQSNMVHDVFYELLSQLILAQHRLTPEDLAAFRVLLMQWQRPPRLDYPDGYNLCHCYEEEDLDGLKQLERYAVQIQALYRGNLERSLFKYHDQDHKDYVYIMETLLNIYSTIFSEDNRFVSCPKLIRALLSDARLDGIEHKYQLQHELENVLSLKEVNSTIKVPQGQWGLVCREHFVVHSTNPIPVKINLFCDIDDYVVRVIDNDTQKEIKRYTNNVAVSEYKRNEKGYTVLCYAWSPIAKPLNYNLCFATKKELEGDKIEVSKLKVEQQTFHGMYVPNTKNIVCNYLLRVLSKDAVLSLHCASSYSEAVINFKLFDETGKMLEDFTGKCDVVIPLISLTYKERVINNASILSSKLSTASLRRKHPSRRHLAHSHGHHPGGLHRDFSVTSSAYSLLSSGSRSRLPYYHGPHHSIFDSQMSIQSGHGGRHDHHDGHMHHGAHSLDSHTFHGGSQLSNQFHGSDWHSHNHGSHTGMHHHTGHHSSVGSHLSMPSGHGGKHGFHRGSQQDYNMHHDSHVFHGGSHPSHQFHDGDLHSHGHGSHTGMHHHTGHHSGVGSQLSMQSGHGGKHGFHRGSQQDYNMHHDSHVFHGGSHPSHQFRDGDLHSHGHGSRTGIHHHTRHSSLDSQLSHRRNHRDSERSYHHPDGMTHHSYSHTQHGAHGSHPSHQFRDSDLHSHGHGSRTGIHHHTRHSSLDSQSSMHRRTHGIHHSPSQTHYGGHSHVFHDGSHPSHQFHGSDLHLLGHGSHVGTQHHHNGHHSSLDSHASTHRRHQGTLHDSERGYHHPDGDVHHSYSHTQHGAHGSHPSHQFRDSDLHSHGHGSHTGIHHHTRHSSLDSQSSMHRRTHGIHHSPSQTHYGGHSHVFHDGSHPSHQFHGSDLHLLGHGSHVGTQHHHTGHHSSLDSQASTHRRHQGTLHDSEKGYHHPDGAVHHSYSHIQHGAHGSHPSHQFHDSDLHSHGHGSRTGIHHHTRHSSLDSQSSMHRRTHGIHHSPSQTHYGGHSHVFHDGSHPSHQFHGSDLHLLGHGSHVGMHHHTGHHSSLDSHASTHRRHQGTLHDSERGYHHPDGDVHHSYSHTQHGAHGSHPSHQFRDSDLHSHGHGSHTGIHHHTRHSSLDSQSSMHRRTHGIHHSPSQTHYGGHSHVFHDGSHPSHQFHGSDLHSHDHGSHTGMHHHTGHHSSVGSHLSMQSGHGGKHGFHRGSQQDYNMHHDSHVFHGGSHPSHQFHGGDLHSHGHGSHTGMHHHTGHHSGVGSQSSMQSGHGGKHGFHRGSQQDYNMHHDSHVFHGGSHPSHQFHDGDLHSHGHGSHTGMHHHTGHHSSVGSQFSMQSGHGGKHGFHRGSQQDYNMHHDSHVFHGGSHPSHQFRDGDLHSHGHGSRTGIHHHTRHSSLDSQLSHRRNHRDSERSYHHPDGMTHHSYSHTQHGAHGSHPSHQFRDSDLHSHGHGSRTGIHHHTRHSSLDSQSSMHRRTHGIHHSPSQTHYGGHSHVFHDGSHPSHQFHGSDLHLLGHGSHVGTQHHHTGHHSSLDSQASTHRRHQGTLHDSEKGYHHPDGAVHHSYNHIQHGAHGSHPSHQFHDSDLHSHGHGSRTGIHHHTRHSSLDSQSSMHRRTHGIHHSPSQTHYGGHSHVFHDGSHPSHQFHGSDLHLLGHGSHVGTQHHHTGHHSSLDSQASTHRRHQGTLHDSEKGYHHPDGAVHHSYSHIQHGAHGSHPSHQFHDSDLHSHGHGSRTGIHHHTRHSSLDSQSSMHRRTHGIHHSPSQTHYGGHSHVFHDGSHPSHQFHGSDLHLLGHGSHVGMHHHTGHHSSLDSHASTHRRHQGTLHDSERGYHHPDGDVHHSYSHTQHGAHGSHPSHQFRDSDLHSHGHGSHTGIHHHTRHSSLDSQSSMHRRTHGIHHSPSQTHYGGHSHVFHDGSHPSHQFHGSDLHSHDHGSHTSMHHHTGHHSGVGSQLSMQSGHGGKHGFHRGSKEDYNMHHDSHVFHGGSHPSHQFHGSDLHSHDHGSHTGMHHHTGHHSSVGSKFSMQSGHGGKHGFHRGSKEDYNMHHDSHVFHGGSHPSHQFRDSELHSHGHGSRTGIHHHTRHSSLDSQSSMHRRTHGIHHSPSQNHYGGHSHVFHDGSHPSHQFHGSDLHLLGHGSHVGTHHHHAGHHSSLDSQASIQRRHHGSDLHLHGSHTGMHHRRRHSSVASQSSVGSRHGRKHGLHRGSAQDHHYPGGSIHQSYSSMRDRQHSHASHGHGQDSGSHLHIHGSYAGMHHHRRHHSSLDSRSSIGSRHGRSHRHHRSSEEYYYSPDEAVKHSHMHQRRHSHSSLDHEGILQTRLRLMDRSGDSRVLDYCSWLYYSRSPLLTLFRLSYENLHEPSYHHPVYSTYHRRHKSKHRKHVLDGGVPVDYRVVITVMDDSWPLTADEWQNVENPAPDGHYAALKDTHHTASRSHLHTVKSTASLRPGKSQSGLRGSVKSLRNRKFSGESRTSRTTKQSSRFSDVSQRTLRRLGPLNTIPEPFWVIQTVVNGGELIELTKNPEHDNELKAMKSKWAQKDPARAKLGQQLRSDFLTQHKVKRIRTSTDTRSLVKEDLLEEVLPDFDLTPYLLKDSKEVDEDRRVLKLSAALDQDTLDEAALIEEAENKCRENYEKMDAFTAEQHKNLKIVYRWFKGIREQSQKMMNDAMEMRRAYINTLPKRYRPAPKVKEVVPDEKQVKGKKAKGRKRKLGQTAVRDSLNSMSNDSSLM